MCTCISHNCDNRSITEVVAPNISPYTAVACIHTLSSSLSICNPPFLSSLLPSASQTHWSFLEMVQNLTLHHLPSLSNTTLLPYLLHSQAANAYDAVWAMSRAWHAVICTLLYTQDSYFYYTERENILGDVLNQILNGTFESVLESEMNYDPSYFQGVSVSVTIVFYLT